MEQNLAKIHQILTKLMGLHSQLLETLRQERDALVSADLKSIQEVTCAKEALLEAIRRQESERMKIAVDLALAWKKPVRELTLPNLIILVQGSDLKAADQFRSLLNALTVLLQRIKEQSAYNRDLVERSLGHIDAMKKNVLGEAVPRSDTYTQQGQRAAGAVAGSSRLISEEA